MSKPKHTPGPWTIHSDGHLRQLDPLGYNVIPQNDADKALIAAAPEMLAALKHLSLFRDFEKNDPEYAAIVRNLIAKAEGNDL